MTPRHRLRELWQYPLALFLAVLVLGVVAGGSVLAVVVLSIGTMRWWLRLFIVAIDGCVVVYVLNAIAMFMEWAEGRGWFR